MKIFWTKRATDKYGSIIEYLKEDFGDNVTSVFKKKTSDFLGLLSEYPEMGSLDVETKNIRSFQLTKQTRVFYRIKKNRIIILTFFNSRQNPKKKPK